MSDLAAALQIAIRVHADQRDKQNAPYLLHVLRVVDAVSDEAKVVAALHDVFEDSDLMQPQVATACGLSVEEGIALVRLTRLPDETYAEYIANISNEGNTIAREVKIADLRDNLSRIPPGQWLSLKQRYEKALAILES